VGASAGKTRIAMGKETGFDFTIFELVIILAFRSEALRLQFRPTISGPKFRTLEKAPLLASLLRLFNVYECSSLLPLAGDETYLLADPVVGLLALELQGERAYVPPVKTG
jgi:hypothetical protein